MKAMIFAAGMGTRLGKITESIPKALVEVNGLTLLHNAVQTCFNAGFDDIIVNVHHHADVVIDEIERLRGIGFKITVSDERDELLETGGGLYKARNFFDDKPFLIYNADIMTSVGIEALYEYHLKYSPLATLLVRNRPGNRFLLVDKEGLLCGWRNRVTGEEILVDHERISFGKPLEEIAFCGIHIVDPKIFNCMNEGKYSLMPLYLDLASKHDIRTMKCNDGYWFDIGTPEKLAEATAYLS